MDRPIAAITSGDISGDNPPTEFRIFAAGENKTLEGSYFFTAQSAKSVIEAREIWGVECMVDLEHLSTVSKDSPNYDPDARCWFLPELRDGELWAVNARWTEDGATRLKNKTQKYLSPTFYFNNETREIEALFNVALTALPKTLNAPALASAEFKESKKMDIAQFVALAKSTGTTTVEDTIDAMRNVVNAFGAPSAKPEEKKEDPKPSEPTPPAPPAQEAATVPTAAPAAPPPEDDKAMAANSAVFSENAQLKSQLATLGAQLDRIESTERRACVAELVKLGVEIPATAWEDEAGSVPVARLRVESVADMKARIAKLSAVKSHPARRNPPTIEVSSLSARELQICSETGCSPERYAALKAQRGEK